MAANAPGGPRFAEGLPIDNTLALIKPGTAQKHGAEIRRILHAHGFSVQAEREVLLSRDQAEAFYAEHKGKGFYDRLVSYMCSAPLAALVLSKVAAVASWRALIGPTNVDVARRDAPGSIRARFGEDGTRNATHGSDAAASAAREIAFFFPEFGAQTLLTGKAAAEWIRMRVVATAYTPGACAAAAAARAPGCAARALTTRLRRAQAAAWSARCTASSSRA